MKTFKIKTLGCKVNQYDSQLIREGLLAKGFSEKENGKKVEFYFINGCTVTSRADSKSFDLIRKSLKENPRAQIYALGCFAKANKKEIKNNFGRKVTIAENFSAAIKKISNFQGHSRAFIKIQDGCNNRCAYCKVPLVRGSSRSRSLEEIRQEAICLIERGFKELVLCGICLGRFGKDLRPRLSLSDAVSALINLRGDFRIRLSSVEAKDISDDLIKIMSDSKKLCPHLHIPFQSGDDSILKRMARKYTSKDYLDVVERIRKKMPLNAITTDIMIGFPGETEKNFKNTLNFLKKVAPARIHCFPFSPRPGTDAFNFKDRVSEVIKGLRMKQILKLARQMSYNYQNKFVGKNLEVLIEAKPDKETGYYRGYSQNYIYTLVKSKELIPGQIAKVKARSVNSRYLIAKTLCNPIS